MPVAPRGHRSCDVPRLAVTAPPIRRTVLGLLGAGTLAAVGVTASPAAARTGAGLSRTVAFRGRHQAGIVTAPQRHLQLLAFDVTTPHAAALARLLVRWTSVAAGATGGSARVSVTFGVGPTLFVRNGRGRFGLAPRRPDALVPLPRFTGDSLDLDRCHGDIVLQVCGDDRSTVRSTAARLVHVADGRARVRWSQAGARAPGPLPRNRFGFHDGNANIADDDVAALDEHVWVPSGPRWLRGGTYLVVRRIRMDLEQWQAETVADQERTIGRFKDSGAPLSGGGPATPVDLTATDASGELLEPPTSHVAVAHPDHNHGVRLLRRGYTYDDGVSARGRPDAGLVFCAFTTNPGRRFVPMQRRLARFDALGRYVVGTGSAVFALPRGLTGSTTWADQVLG